MHVDDGIGLRVVIRPALTVDSSESLRIEPLVRRIKCREHSGEPNMARSACCLRVRILRPERHNLALRKCRLVGRNPTLRHPSTSQIIYQIDHSPRHVGRNSFSGLTLPLALT